LAISPITRPNTIHDRIAIVNPPLLAERRLMQSAIHPNSLQLCQLRIGSGEV
jgi:hypothetical protein